MNETDMEDVGTPTDYKDDNLGYELTKKFESWRSYRRAIEEEWLRDLEAYNQMPEGTSLDNSDTQKRQPPTTYHAHIYTRLAASKADTAYARILEPIFYGVEKHWAIKPTPLPDVGQGELPDDPFLQADMAERAKRMEKEMEDQLINMGYKSKLKNAIQEATIIGTGVVKGIIPSIKREQRWSQTLDEYGQPTWDMATDDVPYPSMGNPLSIFDVFPEPYAYRVEDMTGCFQRHTMNRGQFEALMEDEQFDKEKVREILKLYPKGNHTALYHEVQRRRIAKVLDTSAANSDRFDVLEYWGQVSGQVLQTIGIEEATDPEGVYFCCVWTCAYKTILAKIAPMKRQRIPFNFFKYATVPHQFWGISPIRMVRNSSLPMQNAAIRGLCDDATLNTLPMREVNVNMLKEGEDPRALGPGHTFIRDKGDPAERAITWYSPDSKAQNLIPLLDVSRRMMDEETNTPSYTQGLQIKGANETASGTSMLMSAANITTKLVIDNLQDNDGEGDGLISPLIQSLYDWNMQWNTRDDIKGDMKVEVKGLLALTSKEVQSQRITQVLNESNNPVDVQIVDRRYLYKELCRAVEINPDRAVPDGTPRPNENAIGPVNVTNIQPGMGGIHQLPQYTEGTYFTGNGVMQYGSPVNTASGQVTNAA